MIVTVDEVKTHLRIEHNEEDEYIETLIKQSQTAAEDYCRVSFETDVTLPFLDDSTATTVAQLREDYNHLLAVLRSTGILAPLQEVTPDDRDG